MKRFMVLSVMVSLLLAGCGEGIFPPTATATPTPTPVPTATPIPTATPTAVPLDVCGTGAEVPYNNQVAVILNKTVGYGLFLGYVAKGKLADDVPMHIPDQSMREFYEGLTSGQDILLISRGGVLDYEVLWLDRPPDNGEELTFMMTDLTVVVQGEVQVMRLTIKECERKIFYLISEP